MTSCCTLTPRFTVTECTGVAGRITKETAETARAVFDFTHWLDKNEVIGAITRFSLQVYSPFCPGASWRIDYPLCGTDEPDADVDDAPLILTGATVDQGSVVTVLVASGTPGLSYVVSFIAICDRSGRQKQINLIVTVPCMTNSAMITSLDPVPAGSFTVVSDTTTLNTNTTGSVYVENDTGGEITITLPEVPTNGQTITGVDARGNAATHTIHWVGFGGVLINHHASYDFQVNRQAATFQWDGVEWIVV